MNELAFSTQKFISIVSHDVKAPVRHLTQFSTLLAESLDTLSDEQQQYLDFIQKSADKCNQMMDALTQLSHVHSRANDRINCDFESLLRAQCVNLASQYRCRPLLSVQDIAAKTYAMDPAHAELLLFALADNAFKFREPGGDLEIGLSISASDDWWTLSFTDNGVGIGDDFIDHCTTIFKQYDNRVEGVGLGLAMVEEITRFYDGSLSIKSNTSGEHRGTNVQVRLPTV